MANLPIRQTKIHATTNRLKKWTSPIKTRHNHHCHTEYTFHVWLEREKAVRWTPPPPLYSFLPSLSSSPSSLRGVGDETSPGTSSFNTWRLIGNWVSSVCYVRMWRTWRRHWRWGAAANGRGVSSSRRKWSERRYKGILWLIYLSVYLFITSMWGWPRGNKGNINKNPANVTSPKENGLRVSKELVTLL